MEALFKGASKEPFPLKMQQGSAHRLNHSKRRSGPPGQQQPCTERNGTRVARFPGGGRTLYQGIASAFPNALYTEAEVTLSSWMVVPVLHYFIMKGVHGDLNGWVKMAVIDGSEQAVAHNFVLHRALEFREYQMNTGGV
jgi:hypothetical protein